MRRNRDGRQRLIDRLRLNPLALGIRHQHPLPPHRRLSYDRQVYVFLCCFFYLLVHHLWRHLNIICATPSPSWSLDIHTRLNSQRKTDVRHRPDQSAYPLSLDTRRPRPTSSKSPLVYLVVARLVFALFYSFRIHPPHIALAQVPMYLCALSRCSDYASPPQKTPYVVSAPIAYRTLDHHLCFVLYIIPRLLQCCSARMCRA